MKLVFSLLVLALTCSNNLFSQKYNKPKTDEEIKEALCHTWTATTLESGGIKLPVPAKSMILELTLKNDGTYTRNNRDGEVSGKWTYRPKVMVLELEDNTGGKTFMIGYHPGTFELKYKISNSPPDYIVLTKAN